MGVEGARDRTRGAVLGDRQEGIDLSVVILTWDTKDLLLDCLASLHDNVRGIRFEVILVVNGSRDGTQEAVRRRFPRVRMIENDRNVGFTRGNNMGLRLAGGASVLLLNDDTVVPPDALEEMFRYLESHPDVGCAGPQLTNADGSRQHSVHSFPTVLTEIVPVGLLEWLFPGAYPSKRADYAGPAEVPAVLGACMMIRRDALEKVGLLDEGFFSFLEETDWHLRARQAGYRTVFLPHVRVRHIHGASSKKRFPGPTRVEYYRSLYRFFRKHRGPVVYGVVLALRGFKLTANVLGLALLCLLTGLRRPRVKDRFRSYAYLLAWHLRGRPAGMGLSGGHPPED